LTTRRRKRDPAPRVTQERGCGGKQAAVRSRDPFVPTLTRLVANLGFEFMVCHSKNILYNSVNPFYQLGNNCKINSNSVGIARYVDAYPTYLVAPWYKYI
jgi:hypothetical protein